MSCSSLHRCFFALEPTKNGAQAGNVHMARSTGRSRDATAAAMPTPQWPACESPHSNTDDTAVSARTACVCGKKHAGRSREGQAEWRQQPWYRSVGTTTSSMPLFPCVPFAPTEPGTSAPHSESGAGDSPPTSSGRQHSAAVEPNPSSSDWRAVKRACLHGFSMVFVVAHASRYAAISTPTVAASGMCARGTPAYAPWRSRQRRGQCHRYSE